MVISYMYFHGNNSGTNIYDGIAVQSGDSYCWGWMNLDTVTATSGYKKVTETNPFSSTVHSVGGVPMCVFTTDRGAIIVFFGGITSGATRNTNRQMGIIVQDKSYPDLENNTLIIYSTDGTMGTYTTPIYQNEKVINGKIYQRFNDVNLWDTENQTLIKNLTTYYGNGTDWIQIK